MAKILWLASWYPNRTDPFDGDFVQRHAMATALHEPLVVFHVVQNGQANELTEIKEEIFRLQHIEEHLIYFPFKKTGIALLDKLRYNLKYDKVYRSVLNQYLAQNEKPALVHVHVPVKAGRIARWLKRRYQIPYVVTEHSSIYLPQVEDAFYKRNSFFKRNTRLAFKDASLVTSVSQKICSTLQQLFKLNNTSVFPNVVDTELFYPLENKSKLFRFIHVSMMHPLKNVEGIIRTLHKLDATDVEWEFVFVGPAPQRYIEAALGLKHKIIWRGECSYQQVAHEMQRANALVVFSHYENQPCVISEAHCCGLPVIATNVGGIVEMITNENGMLIEPNNEEQLYNAMICMLSDENKFNSTLIAKEAKTIYSYPVVGKQIVDLYDFVLKSK